MGRGLQCKPEYFTLILMIVYQVDGGYKWSHECALLMRGS